jgi:uncharacterized membrane protein HdeD (DUF308 family)
MISGIILIVVGIAAIAFGLTADRFYGGFLRRPSPGEKPGPKWLGRTISIIVGTYFIYSGVLQIRGR